MADRERQARLLLRAYGNCDDEVYLAASTLYCRTVKVARGVADSGTGHYTPGRQHPPANWMQTSKLGRYRNHGAHKGGAARGRR